MGGTTTSLPARFVSNARFALGLPLEKVRDVSFGEDTAASRTGSRLADLATIRAAIIILHLGGLD